METRAYATVSAPGKLLDADAGQSCFFNSKTHKRAAPEYGLSLLSAELPGAYTSSRSLRVRKNILVIVNSAEHVAFLQSIWQMSSVDAYIHKISSVRPEHEFSAWITEAVQTMDRCVWIYIADLSNVQWLKAATHLVSTQRERLEHRLELLPIVGIRLLLGTEVKRERLPKGLQALCYEPLPEVFTHDASEKLQTILLQHASERYDKVVTIVERETHELFLYITIHLRQNSEATLTREECDTFYNILVDILEDSSSILRQYIQLQCKIPHLKITQKSESTQTLEIEIRPTTDEHFALFSEMWRSGNLASTWLENIKQQHSTFPCVLDITIKCDCVDIIKQMLAKERTTLQGRRLADMLETDGSSPFQHTGLIKNSEPSPSTKSGKTLTAKGVMFYSKLFQEYLSDSTRTPAEFLKLLRQKECSWDVLLSIRDTKSYPAMHMAVLAGRVDFLAMFLYLGLWGRLRQQVVSTVVSPYSTPAHGTGYTARRVAESLSCKNTFQHILKDFDEYDEIWRNMTPLPKACSMGDLLIAETLIKCLTEELSQSEVEECLLYACGSGNHQLVCYIVEKFSTIVRRVLSLTPANRNNRRCVDISAMLGHTDIVNTISTQMTVNCDYEALEQCALNGDVVGANILIRHGKKWSPSLVMLAAKKCQEGFVTHVLENASDLSIDVNGGSDEDGQNALHHAVTNGALKIIGVLFKHNADIKRVDKYGRNVFHLAIASQKTETVELLINKANEEGCLNTLINQHDFFIGKDIYYVVRGKDNGTKLWYWVKLKRLLLHAFEEALKKGHLDVAMFGQVLYSGRGSVANAKSDLDVEAIQEGLLVKKDKDMTPLHIAVHKANVPLVKTLLAARADPNARDYCLATPAHFAAMVGSVTILDMLEKCGADLEAKTVDGKTPCQVAQDNDHGDVVNYIDAGSIMKKAQNFTQQIDSTIGSLSPTILDYHRGQGRNIQSYIVDKLRDLTIDINLVLMELGSGPVTEEGS